MKKFLTNTLALCLAILAFMVLGCSKERFVLKETDTFIVITVSPKQMQIAENTTLIDYMQSLKADGALNFELTSGMISSINGIENPADWSSCWMLYTDDTENANAAWGEVEYQEKIYGSSIFGAEELKIKDGCVYIWVYQAFTV